MANYTAHYHLHQWEPEDSFLRRDFNEDFQKIDAGLAGRGDCSLLFGSYVGTGTCGPSEPTALTLGIPAKALWVSCGSRHAVFLRGNTQAVNFSTSDGELLEVEWTQDGLSWKLGGGLYNHDYQQLNEAGTTYYYAALYQESKEAPGNTRGLLASWGLVIRTQRIVKVPSTRVPSPALLIDQVYLPEVRGSVFMEPSPALIRGFSPIT